MAVTPLIKKISDKNGTFIAFQSAINDSNLISSQQGYKFAFSKYALIKIPEIKRSEALSGSDVTITDSNYLNLDGIGDTFNTGSTTGETAISKDFAESFQNYCLNLESTILSSHDTVASLNANVSEEIFFKWLKETGAIRFEESNNGDKAFAKDGYTRFIEPRDLTGYDSVVKYINEISAVNVTMDGSIYTEVYVYTPTDHGSSPVVLFTSGENDVYASKSGEYYSSNNEWINGRSEDDTSTHPDNLDVHAIFDYDGEGDASCYIREDDSEDWESGHWYDDYMNNNTTSAGFYFVDSIGSTKDYEIKKVSSSNNYVGFKRSTLDGIKIDWNISESYSLEKYTSGITDTELANYTLNEFNTVGDGSCKEFEYNAVLLYYDLTRNDETKSYLYGIYFINAVTAENSTTAYIPCATKYRSNSLSTVEGNAIGYKINLRTDTSYANLENISTSTASRNFSMDLFNESLSNMKKYFDTVSENITYITNLYNEVDELRRLFIDDQNKDEILERISILEEDFANFKDVSLDVDKLANMSNYIDDLYSKYSNIMNNNTSIKVEYNYNKVKINSLVTHNQAYDMQPNKYKFNFFSEDGNVLTLNEYTNYYKHYDEDYEISESVITLTSNYDIIISDKETQWVSGQVVRLVFSTPVNLDGNAIDIYTDYKNVSNSGGSFKKLIASIEPEMFEENETPIFEIICINPDSMDFEIDKIK